MNKSVLVGMIAVTGMAASAFGQSPSPSAAGHTIEIRLVVDGRAGTPGSGIDLFPENGVAPGFATAIGITVQARVLCPATVPDARGGTFPPVAVSNWGISGVANGSITGTAPQLSAITVVDPMGGAQLQRGRTTAPANNGYGAFNPFRGTFSGSGENNTATGGNRATGNANGATLPATLTKNGFIDTDTNGNQRIRGMDLGYGSNLNNRTTQLATLSNNASDTSNWQNIYRFIYIPTNVPNLPSRQISISISAYLRFVYQENFTSGGGPNGEDVWTYFGLSEIVLRSDTVTFFVPTPGAAAILGIGGLVAARRRRA